MDASTLTLRQVFEPDRRYLVPLFQRPYVWTESGQWAPLWDDVKAVAERLEAGDRVGPHFLGAIVLNQLLQPVTRVEARQVIDGQQRLTTLQLLLEAVSDTCLARRLERYHRAFLKLTRNEDPLTEAPDDIYKVWPTNIDRDDFRAVMESHSPEAFVAECEVHGRNAERPIALAYRYFTHAVRDWVGASPAPDDRIAHLHTALRDWVRLVVIDLAADDDPQLIFETLNARGTRLLPADLVKNYLFHAAERSGLDTESLYARYWKRIDEEAGYWRAEVTSGRYKRPRIDLFLQHYLTMQAGEEVLVTHLYTDFRRHLERSVSSPEEHLASISRYGRIYRRLDDYDSKSKLGAFFRRLGDLEVTTVYPLLLELFGRELPSEALEAVVTDIESFLVRRLVCRLTTKNYNRLFLDLLRAVRQQEGDPREVVRMVLLAGEGESVRWPTDREFRNAWMDMPLYRTVPRKRVRMLLETLEQALRGPRTEAVTLPAKLTVEHLMPQGWRTHWPLPMPAPTKEIERDRLVHSIGNLTLVTGSLNPALSNGPWREKVQALQEHSLLMLNRRVSGLAGWDEGTIRARAASLFEVAAQLWPRPATPETLVAPVSYAEVGNAALREDPADAPAGDRSQPCPITGCDFRFERWPMGWDAHVGRIRKHPGWHPEITDPEERRNLFRAEFAPLLNEIAPVAADREYWATRATPESLGLLDQTVSLLSQAGLPPRVTYNRGHVAMGGPRSNFAWFHPRRSDPDCQVYLKAPEGQVSETVQGMRSSGLDAAPLGPRNVLKLVLRTEDFRERREAILEGFLPSARIVGGQS